MGILRLNGPSGALDIVTVYLDTGDATTRRTAEMRIIAGVFRLKEQALTLLLGDFNFVTNDRERWNKRQSQWSGAGDRNDQEEFQRILAEPHDLHELFQPHLTCDMGTAISKLDRIYSNHNVTDQLDRHYSCTALFWTSLSAHRPIAFSRIPPSHQRKSPSLPAAPLDHP